MRISPRLSFPTLSPVWLRDAKEYNQEKAMSKTHADTHAPVAGI